ncbi:MAG: winged helix DNA-binding protein [Chloroflexi bacterium]|nr:winged helix DNA-binding protein [Chloroflexota bacterium]
MKSDPRGTAGLTHQEEYELWGLLTQLNGVMFRARGSELRSLGLSSVQVWVMHIIRLLKKSGVAATPAEISRWMYREPHTISALLGRMEKQGLVRCIRQTQGKRQVLAELTEKGEQVYRRQNQERRVVARILGCLSAEERSQLRAFLERMRQQGLAVLADKPLFP